MGAQIQHLGGYQPGDIDVCVLTTYVQGQPLKINTSGQLELCICYREGNDDGYVGLAKGFSGSLSRNLSDIYNGKATYWAGYNTLKLDNQNPRDPDHDDYPYDINDTFTPGDDLYINSSAKLTNAAGPYDTICANSTPVALVLATPSGVAEASPAWLEIYQVR